MGSGNLRAKWLWYQPSERKLKLGFDAGLADAEPVRVVDVNADGDAEAAGGPAVTSLALGLAPGGSWTDGDRVRMTLAFSEPVTVETDGGTPSVGIALDGTARQASYASGTGTASLAFSYTVTADDGTVSAVLVTADSLALNGGTIRDAGGRDADLGHPGVGEAAESDDSQTESASALMGFTLVDAGSGAEAALADGDALVLNDPANGSYGLAAAVASDAGVGSVRLALTGAKTVAVTDNAAPFSLYGDEDGTVSGAGLPAGFYTLSATAYAEADGGGAELGTLAVSFTVAASEGAVDPDGLTSSFEGVPASHDGSAAFTFNVAFSEDVGISYVTLRDESFAVTDGDVAGARRVDGRHDLWEITVEPESREAVTISLPGGRACGTAGAVCTRGDDPRPLSNSPSATVAGPAADPAMTNTAATGAPTISGTPQVDETLTASVSSISDADGLDNASYEYQWIRGSTDIQDATDSSYTLVSVDAGETITVRVAFSDDEGHEESLTSAATDAVAPAPEPLTATFTDVPSEHAGEGETFTFGLTFSEEFGLSYVTLRDDAFSVSGGAVRKAKREQQGSNVAWEITVEPDSAGAVTIALPQTTDCDADGAICTSDDRPLSHSLSATIAGPVGISVADARVDENGGAPLAFAVTLSRATSGPVTVYYATSDGSAQAGVDYTAASGTLTFQAGESSQTVNVTVLDDSHDDTEETLTLTLSNPSSGRLTDAEATGTIVNADPLPRALLARFGRTAAVHVVEHVEERLQAPREPGFRGRVAGRELRRGMERELALGFLSQLGSAAGVHPVGAGGHGGIDGAPRPSRPAG